MDAELEKELARVRAKKTAAASERQERSERNTRLAAQFRDALVEHSVKPYPIYIETRRSASVTKKERYAGWGSAKIKRTYQTYTHTYRLVGQGWTIKRLARMTMERRRDAYIRMW